MYGHADARDARRVGHGEIVASLHGHASIDLDLAAQVHEEGAVGHVHDGDALDAADTLGDALAVRLVARLEADVAGDFASHLHDIDGADVPALGADGGRDLAEHAGLVDDADPDDEAVTGYRRIAHEGLHA